MCADCLEGYAAAEAEVGKQRIAANDGKLCCPSDGCKAVFEHQSLAQHLPQAAFTKLLAAWKSCIELKAVNEAAEQARAAAALQAAQSGVAKARAHIIDTILTLQCPRCTKAFDSFEGCFALLCRDSEGHGCGAAFCAYCLHDCGRDAHAHVAVCAHNTAPRKEVFGTVHMFEAVQRARRQQLVQQYLQTLPARLRELVQRATVQDLRDLGIVLNALGSAEPPLMRQQQQQQQQQRMPQRLGGLRQEPLQHQQQQQQRERMAAAVAQRERDAVLRERGAAAAQQRAAAEQVEAQRLEQLRLHELREQEMLLLIAAHAQQARLRQQQRQAAVAREAAARQQQHHNLVAAAEAARMHRRQQLQQQQLRRAYGLQEPDSKGSCCIM
eukprot:20291-Heterococcus_DN1.PRE.1